MATMHEPAADSNPGAATATPTPSPSTSNKPPTTEQPIYNWKDITSQFVEACGELQLGELLHDSK